MKDDIQGQPQTQIAPISTGSVTMPAAEPWRVLASNPESGTMSFPSLWDSAGEIFNTHGLQPKQRQIGFLTLITLNAAAWGNPLAVALIDESGSQAISLLNLCLGMAPQKSVMEFSSLDPKALFRGGLDLKGKAIVGFDASRFKKTLPDLIQLLQRTMLTTYQPNEKEKRGYQANSVEGPISWVMIANRNQSVLSSPMIIKLPVVLDNQTVGNNLLAIANAGQSQSDYGLELKIACVRKTLERLCPRSIEISFGGQIIGSLNSNIPDLQVKFGNLINLLRNIAIINNQPEIIQQELFSSFLGLQHQQLNPNVQPLQATKVDYYYLWVLMDGAIPGGDEFLTQRQQRIFKVILDQNLMSLENKFLNEAEKNDEALLLRVISHPDNYTGWADQEGILQTVNKDGGEKVSMATLYNEINMLVDQKLISKQKDPKSKNKYLYYINVLSVDDGEKLLHPSKIIDPVYNGQAVQVINPLTGQTEEI